MSFTQRGPHISWWPVVVGRSISPLSPSLEATYTRRLARVCVSTR